MTEGQILSMASVVNASAQSIYEALKYIYFISYEDFYDINVKDIFKIALSDITDNTVLGNLGFKVYPDRIGDLKNPEFMVVKRLICYAFAVRLPFLKTYLQPKSELLTETDLKNLFKTLCDAGAANIDDIVTMDFKENLRAVKSKDAKEPVFDTEWFKTWVYTYGKEFSAINNKNMFFLGCADALFPLFWSSVTDRLLDIIEKSAKV